METVTDFIFLGFKIIVVGDSSHEIKRCLFLRRKTLINLDSILKKKKRRCFTNKSPFSQRYEFSSSHVWMWEVNHKEVWAPKTWWFQIVVLEKILEGPLGSKEIKPINPKGNQPWIFTGRSDAEAEAPVLWSSDVKSQLTGKYPDARKDWGMEEKGTKEDEMIGWHHLLNVHEFEQALGDSEG